VNRKPEARMPATLMSVSERLEYQYCSGSNKFSSKYVVTKEECASTIKWVDIVAGRRAIYRDFKMSTLHEIPTVIIGLVVSKV